MMGFDADFASKIDSPAFGCGFVNFVVPLSGIGKSLRPRLGGTKTRGEMNFAVRQFRVRGIYEKSLALWERQGF